MKRFIFLVVIGILSVTNAILSKNQEYPSRLEWLFGTNNKQDENKEENKPTVCQSQECKKIAQIISENMDSTVDPCDDFYEHACGKWPEHNPIPKGMDTWSMFENAQVNVERQMKEIYDESPKEDDLLAVKVAKKWYSVCMNTDAMEKQGLQPLIFTLSRIGGWPLIMEPDEWNEEEYSWQKVDDQYVRLTGNNAFHDVRVTNLNATQIIVHIDTPHLPPGSYKLWNEINNDEEEDESDEDPSDEEKQSDEQEGSQEPGSEDDNKSDNNDDNNDNENNNSTCCYKDSNDDDESDNNDDDKGDNNDDDDDNDTNEQNDEDNAKKRVGMKKNGKFAKNKKHGRKRKSNIHPKKHGNHKTKKDRIKRWAIPTNIREKLRAWKNKKNNVKQERIERLKKTLEATTPQISIEKTIDEDDNLKKYANYISEVARAMAQARGVEVSEEYMNKDIQDMMEFHTKLVDISMEPNDDEVLTLNDFQEWYNEKKPNSPNSKIDWEYKIGELFDEAHVSIGGDLDLEIGTPNYFESLLALLDETPSRTIVNYIHWNFLSRMIKTTTKEMRKLYNVWEGKEVNDDKEILGVPIRFHKCTREVKISDILAYEYVRNHFSDEITTTASDMMDDIQKEVEYEIKKSDWMDENTKDFVLAKLVNMAKFIGYPDWYRNNTIVKRYFQGLVIGNSYYENTLSYVRYSKWKGLRRLLKKDEGNTIRIMTMSPVMVNAFFSSYHNSIALSAADFQSPLFAYNRPQVINYGIIGSIMGHEVNHGFDSTGRKYDKKGKPVEWLSAMAEAYSKRAGCFVEQFNNYPVDKATNYKIKNYGNHTIRENIADTMGLEASFRAYRRRERECGKSDVVLPGHENINNDQLFFLSFANLWCEAAKTSNATINNAKIDVHSIGRLRVIGSISNSQDFAEVYNCPIGSAMNPEKKCHIWK